MKWKFFIQSYRIFPCNVKILITANRVIMQHIKLHDNHMDRCSLYLNFMAITRGRRATPTFAKVWKIQLFCLKDFSDFSVFSDFSDFVDFVDFVDFMNNMMLGVCPLSMYETIWKVNFGQHCFRMFRLLFSWHAINKVFCKQLYLTGTFLIRTRCYKFKSLPVSCYSGKILSSK